MMHPLYLPFTEEQLVSHFADVRQKGGKCSKNVKQLEYYKQGIERYTNKDKMKGKIKERKD